jgi:hypothetical protein
VTRSEVIELLKRGAMIHCIELSLPPQSATYGHHYVLWFGNSHTRINRRTAERLIGDRAVEKVGRAWKWPRSASDTQSLSTDA